MDIEEFSKLEEKIKNIVNNLKALQVENHKLKEELKNFKKRSSSYDEERTEIKKKISGLIGLIESIEK